MHRRLIPLRLHPRATIGVIAPASPPAIPGKLERGIVWLESQGYAVLRGKSLEARFGYLSGDDETRASDINAMFADDSVDAIFCSRGGYGSSRLLGMIDYRLIRRKPKIFVGYSDVTALSMAMYRQCGFVTFAGPMVAAEMQSGMDSFTTKCFFEMLTRKKGKQPLPIGTTNPSDIFLHVSGIAEGILLGGNLSLLVTLLGTKYEPDWGDAILFLEDVGENVYRIDRMLCHLRNAGVLRKVRGILLGTFSAVPEDSPNRDLGEVLREYFEPLRVPVLSGIPFGHTRPKITLPFGIKVRMNSSRNSVRILEPVVG